MDVYTRDGFGAGGDWTMKNWGSFRSGSARVVSSGWFGLTFLGLLALLPTPLLAQGISGRVLDAETENPVSGAVIVLTDLAGNTVGQARANAEGSFSIFVGQQGNFSVNVEMIGYETGGSGKISFSDTNVLIVDLMITPVPVVLDDFTVTGKSEALTYMQKTGFYERRARGFGNYIEPNEQQREHLLIASDLVRRVPGLSTNDGMVFSSRGSINGAYALSRTEAGQLRAGIRVQQSPIDIRSCALKVMVDGIDRGVDLDFVTSRIEVLAIEVYKSFATIPARWQHAVSRGSRDRQGNPVPTCGLILVWTRHS